MKLLDLRIELKEKELCRAQRGGDYDAVLRLESELRELETKAEILRPVIKPSEYHGFRSDQNRKGG